MADPTKQVSFDYQLPDRPPENADIQYHMNIVYNSVNILALQIQKILDRLTAAGIP